MYANIVDIDSIPAMPGNKMVSVCGYVRKVLHKYISSDSYYNSLWTKKIFKYIYNFVIRSSGPHWRMTYQKSPWKSVQITTHTSLYRYGVKQLHKQQSYVSKKNITFYSKRQKYLHLHKKHNIYLNIVYFQALRQLVILFDLKTTSKNDANKPDGSLALLNSTASTYLHTNSSDIEVEPITVSNIIIKTITLNYCRNYPILLNI